MTGINKKCLTFIFISLLFTVMEDKLKVSSSIMGGPEIFKLNLCKHQGIYTVCHKV